MYSGAHELHAITLRLQSIDIVSKNGAPKVDLTITESEKQNAGSDPDDLAVGSAV